MWIDGAEIKITGRLIKTARLREEWYRDIENPLGLLERLKGERKRSGLAADIFTFWQRLPDVDRKHEYYTELDSIAVIPIKSYSYWWEHQINPKVRNMVRKAEKKGVEIRISEYDDKFIAGMTKIFNESPIRQGRPFWHFGKDFETIKREFSRNLFREKLLAAYYMNELIGFVFLADAGRYADVTQIVASLRHRDKSPINALLAKAVQICDERECRYLAYGSWINGTLGDFKRHNGFERIDLPRYYIPLSIMGVLALKARLHHGVRGVLPRKLETFLRALRSDWYARGASGPQDTLMNQAEVIQKPISKQA